MRGRATRLLLVAAAVPIALGAAARAPAQTLPCEAPATVKEAFRNLPQGTGDARADDAARVAALKALVRRYPNDVFVHQRYQDTAMYPDVKDRDAVIAEYKQLADKHPKSVLYAYLYARARVGSNTKQVMPILEKQAPAMPPARLALVRIYQSTAFKDAAKLRAQLEAFIAACPSTVSPYQYMRSIEPSDFLKASTERLRKILQTRTDVEGLGYYSTLWALEFRVKPANEHDALRKQVAEDLKRLRTMDPGKGTSLYYTMQEGYDLVSDKEGSRWTADQIARVPGSGVSAAESRWYKDNPYPKPTDPPEKRKAYNESLVKASADWVKMAPYEPSVWFNRVEALAGLDKPAAADVEAAGEGLLKAVERNPGQMSFMSETGGTSYALVVAHLYAKNGVRLDRLPDLVAQGIPELEKSTRVGSWESDLYPSRPDDGSNLDWARWYGRLTIADIWIETKDVTRARAALLDLQKLADGAKPADAKDAKKQQTYLTRQAGYWARMGDLAQLEGHKTDAMTYYQNAVLVRPKPPSSGQKDELGEKARTLWTGIGGSNEAWQAWFGRRDLLGGAAPDAAAAAFTKMEKALPEFDLTDLSGAHVRLADFKGKATLVGIWATW